MHFHGVAAMSCHLVILYTSLLRHKSLPMMYRYSIYKIDYSYKLHIYTKERLNQSQNVTNLIYYLGNFNQCLST